MSKPQRLDNTVSRNSYRNAPLPLHWCSPFFLPYLVWLWGAFLELCVSVVPLLWPLACAWLYTSTHLDTIFCAPLHADQKATLTTLSCSPPKSSMAFGLNIFSLHLIKSYLHMHLDLLNCSRSSEVIGNMRDLPLGADTASGAASVIILLKSDGFPQRVIYLLDKKIYIYIYIWHITL